MAVETAMKVVLHSLVMINVLHDVAECQTECTFVEELRRKSVNLCAVSNW